MIRHKDKTRNVNWKNETKENWTDQKLQTKHKIKPRAELYTGILQTKQQNRIYAEVKNKKYLTSKTENQKLIKT